jgi:hypothetical protein
MPEEANIHLNIYLMDMRMRRHVEMFDVTGKRTPVAIPIAPKEGQ